MSREANPDLLFALASEFMGEALYRTLYYTTLKPERRRMAQVLWQLETQTKSLLLDYCEINALRLPSTLGWRLKGLVGGLVLFLVPWRTYLRGTVAETEKFLEVFRRLEAQAQTVKEEELFRYVVAHEEAIQRFAQLALEGVEDSIAPVLALLD